MRSPVTSHETGNSDQDFFIFQVKDANGFWQLGISDYANSYLLTKDRSGITHVAISQFNDFVAYDVADMETGLKTIVIRHLPTQKEFVLFKSMNSEHIEAYNPVFSDNNPYSLSYFIKGGKDVISVGVINLFYHPMSLGLIPSETQGEDKTVDEATVLEQKVDYSQLTRIDEQSE